MCSESVSPREEQPCHPQAGRQAQLHHCEEANYDHDDHIKVPERVLELAGGVGGGVIGHLDDEEGGREEDEDACAH